MKKPVQRDPTQKKGQDSVGKVGYAALHIIPTEFPYPRPERYQARPPRVLRLPVLGACVGSAGGEDTGHLACNLKQLVGLTASNMAAGIHPPSRAPRHPTGVGEHFWVYFGD